MGNPGYERGERLHRAQILLEADQHRALARIAEQEGRSISDVVREIVQYHLAEKDHEARLLSELRALERLGQIRGRLQEEHGTYQGDLLDEVRTERQEDVDRVWRGEL